MKLFALCLLIIAIAACIEAAAKHSVKRAGKRNSGINSSKRIHNGMKKVANHQKGNGHSNDASDIQEKIKMVRHLVNDAKYVAVSSHSTLIPGYVDANLQIAVDGGRGVPYTYMSDNDISVVDLYKNNKSSLLYSQATVDDSCNDYPLQAKDPKCARALLIGELYHVDKDSDDYKFGWETLLETVPAFADLDKDEYKVGKLEIKGVYVRGDDGKAQELPLEDYMNFPPINDNEQ